MRTPITCQTTDTGYTLKVGTRTGEKYSLPGQRNLMFCIYTEQMPKTENQENECRKAGRKSGDRVYDNCLVSRQEAGDLPAEVAG